MCIQHPEFECWLWFCLLAWLMSGCLGETTPFVFVINCWYRLKIFKYFIGQMRFSWAYFLHFCKNLYSRQDSTEFIIDNILTAKLKTNLLLLGVSVHASHFHILCNSVKYSKEGTSSICQCAGLWAIFQAAEAF